LCSTHGSLSENIDILVLELVLILVFIYTVSTKNYNTVYVAITLANNVRF